MGDLLTVDEDTLMRVVDVNSRAPVKLMRGLLPMTAARGRGAVVLVPSLAGNQSSPRIGAYKASKARGLQALWSRKTPHRYRRN